jgi:hypothetical protein
MIMRSPNVRPAEFAIGDAKRLLQQYRHETDMPTTLRDVRFQGQSGKHMLALSSSQFDPKWPLPIVVLVGASIGSVTSQPVTWNAQGESHSIPGRHSIYRCFAVARAHCGFEAISQPVCLLSELRRPTLE